MSAGAGAPQQENPQPSAGIVDSQPVRPPEWAENNADTMVARRSRAESATSWWTPRAWCSKPGFTAQRSKTGRVSKRYWKRCRIASPSASLTFGWTRRLHRSRGQGRRLGGEGPGMDGTDSTPPAEAGTGGGDEEVGKRMGQRGCSDRSREALFGAKEVRGSASPVGGRTDLFLALSKQVG